MAQVRSIVVEKQEAIVVNSSDQNERAASVPSGQPPKKVLRANTAAFITLQRDNLRRACEKYAWVAQHEGLVLRKNPLKQAPLKDWVYRRVAKADFGIPYIDKSGHKKLWYPDLPTMLAAYFEPGMRSVIPTIAPNDIELLKERVRCRVEAWPALRRRLHG